MHMEGFAILISCPQNEVWTDFLLRKKSYNIYNQMKKWKHLCQDVANKGQDRLEIIRKELKKEIENTIGPLQIHVGPLSWFRK